MNETPVTANTLSPDERLALAREAYLRYHTSCFWFMREDARIGEEHIETIIRGLRAHGDRDAFRIAARLCR